MSAWPINWGFGGISWNDMYGVKSLYFALVFGRVNKRKALGFIVRFVGKGAPVYSDRRHKLLFNRLIIKRY